MSEVRAPVALPRALVVMLWALAALFNVVFLSFFAFYSVANDWAVERSEATGAFEPSQLLPHDAALWLSAHAALVLLVVLDAVAVALAFRLNRRSVNQTQ
ncbi:MULTISPECIES: hypothetical protein [Curtobacterium]|uniref:hypothetical protein n=1 Tax=Curtobacterium flaccumfaciens TaxID=2035 RepID=UPI003EE59412